MDLLTTILRSCNCEQYIDNFRSNEIDPFTLKILNDEDLKIIGIDEEGQHNMLQYIKNLQLPAERVVDTVVDKQYMIVILNQISMQLHKHFANLICASKREDTDLCNVELIPAINCLQNQLTDLEKELYVYDDTVLKRKHKKRKINILFPTILLTSLALLMCRHYFAWSKLTSIK